MKKKIIIAIVLFCSVSIIFLTLYLLPMMYEKECKERVYSDLQDVVQEAKKSVIGVIPVKSDVGNVSLNGLGSGVIFEKSGNTYYAITAAHVLEKDAISFKLFTILTPYQGQTIQASDTVSFVIPDESYHNSLIDAKVEYISDTDDLAILSFESTDKLEVIEFEEKNDFIGERIVAIGHPNGNHYQCSYGSILSNEKEIMIKLPTGESRTEKVVEHDAYLN